MRRTVLALAVLSAVSGCAGGAATATPSSTSPSAAAPSSSPYASEQLPTATVEAMFGQEVQKQGFVPRFGTVEGAITLARDICGRFKTGADYATVAGVLTKDGMTPSEAGSFTGMATVAFCPEYASKLNH